MAKNGILRVPINVGRGSVGHVALNCFLGLNTDLKARRFIRFHPVLMSEIFFLRLFLSTDCTFLAFCVILCHRLCLNRASNFRFFNDDTNDRYFGRQLLIFHNVQFREDLLVLLPFLPSLHGSHLGDNFLLFRYTRHLFLDRCPTFIFKGRLFRLNVHFLLGDRPLICFRFILLRSDDRASWFLFRLYNLSFMEFHLRDWEVVRIRNFFRLLFRFLLPSYVNYGRYFNKFAVRRKEPRADAFIRFYLLSFFFLFLFFMRAGNVNFFFFRAVSLN